MAKTKSHLVRWGIQKEQLYRCRPIQTDDHILQFHKALYRIADRRGLMSRITRRKKETIEY